MFEEEEGEGEPFPVPLAFRAKTVRLRIGEEYEGERGGSWRKKPVDAAIARFSRPVCVCVCEKERERVELVFFLWERWSRTLQ